MEPVLGIDIHFHVFGRYICLSTPQWNRENHRPSWYPKWKFETINDLPCNSSKWFHLDWFFHFVMAYGPPATGTSCWVEETPVSLTPEESAELDRFHEELKGQDLTHWFEEKGDSP